MSSKSLSLPSIPWFFVTRTIGVVMIGYGLLFDETDDRGTIILAGVGIAFGDKVARAEPAKPPPPPAAG